MTGNRIDNNQAVFTVLDIFRNGALIQYVVHDAESDWQFLPGYEVPANNMMIVSLSEIIEKDKSVNEILSLQIGYQAYRKSINDEWQITKLVQGSEQK